MIFLVFHSIISQIQSYYLCEKDIGIHTYTGLDQIHTIKVKSWNGTKCQNLYRYRLKNTKKRLHALLKLVPVGLEMFGPGAITKLWKYFPDLPSHLLMGTNDSNNLCKMDYLKIILLNYLLQNSYYHIESMRRNTSNVNF